MRLPTSVGNAGCANAKVDRSALRKAVNLVECLDRASWFMSPSAVATQTIRHEGEKPRFFSEAYGNGIPKGGTAGFWTGRCSF